MTPKKHKAPELFRLRGFMLLWKYKLITEGVMTSVALVFINDLFIDHFANDMTRLAATNCAAD